MVSIIHFWVHLHGIAVDKASIVPDFGIQLIFRKNHCVFQGLIKRLDSEPAK